jgi:putative tricarboxylic transport membrane protein
MELLSNLHLGFVTALSPVNLLFCLLGATAGTLIGILPGIGPVTAIAMLLPLTFKMPPLGALIMLSGIYYGAHHAGSTTAVMLNMPGEPSSVVICLDGHPMARKGRAGPALAISAFGSFFAGCVSVIAIAGLSPVLAKAALLFGPAEYFSMIVMALVATSVLSNDRILITLCMCATGLLLGSIGTDIMSGVDRFTFGFPQLEDGIDFVAVAVGVFACTEIVMNAGIPLRRPTIGKIGRLMPSKADIQASWRPAVRGTILGGILGIVPGTGPLLSSFASYAMERKIAKDPSRFGKGAIEGVAGPESANNAAALTHFIPMLTLGIPAGAAMALMLGALQIQGISPGPQVMTKYPSLFWGLIASMWLGNMMLLVLNLPMIGLWIRLLAIPFRVLYPAILVFCCIGVFSVNSSSFDVALAGGFGLLGVMFKVLGCSPAPLVLALVLEPLLEENFRRAMIISGGQYSIFVQRPVSLGILIGTVALILYFFGRRAPPRDAEVAVTAPAAAPQFWPEPKADVSPPAAGIAMSGAGSRGSRTPGSSLNRQNDASGL